MEVILIRLEVFFFLKVERGSLLRSISMTEDNDVMRELKEMCRDGPSYKEPLFMKCLDVSNVFVRVPSSEVCF